MWDTLKVAQCGQRQQGVGAGANIAHERIALQGGHDGSDHFLCEHSVAVAVVNCEDRSTESEGGSDACKG